MTRPERITLHTVCGIEELPGHGERGVGHVLSILDPGTPEPEAFRAYPAHRRVTLRFHDAVSPNEKMVLPEQGDVAAILEFGAQAAADEAEELHILVHCHLGISRSTAALTTLLAQARPEMPSEEVVEHVYGLRKQAWPNSRMIAFADTLLDRGGSLSEAVRRLHARQLTRKPEFGRLMRELGRGSEVDAALRG